MLDDALEDAPLDPRAHTLPRGVHGMPFADSEGASVILLVAVTSKGVRVFEEEVRTRGQQARAIATMVDILDFLDPLESRAPIQIAN